MFSGDDLDPSLTINHKMRIYVPGSTVDSIHRQSNYLVSTSPDKMTIMMSYQSHFLGGAV